MLSPDSALPMTEDSLEEGNFSCWLLAPDTRAQGFITLALFLMVSELR